MAKAKLDKQRERRIQQEIVVDAHDAEEQAMGWCYYLEEQLCFPFRAKCIVQRAISPLRKGQQVEVVGLAPAEECDREMFITVTWEDRTLAVPLAFFRIRCSAASRPDRDVMPLVRRLKSYWPRHARTPSCRRHMGKGQ